MKIRSTLSLVTLGLAALLSACDGDSLSGPGFVCDVTNPVSDILLNPSSATLLVHSPAISGDTVQIAAVTTNRAGGVRTDVPIRFTSSDTTVATVDSLGVVHGRTTGTVKITAASCDKKSSVQVTVISSVARVAISPLSDTVIVGDTAVVVARAFAPDGSQVSKVRFAFGSSNPGITIVQNSDSTAKVTGSSAGSATITAVGEGTSGTSSLLILARAFLAGNASTNTIEVGDAFACGLITLGHGFCWGQNNHGQIAAKTDSTCFPGTDPGAIVNDSLKTTAVPCSLLPLRISQAIDFTTISAGDSTGCAISVAGRAYCWGTGLHGENGNGTTADKSQPTLVTSGLIFTSISVGGQHTCALATGGTAYCWGDDSKGQLGDARLVSSTTPIPVSGGGGPGVFSSISAGFRHSCAIASDGTGFCWGSNDFGQLGDGSNVTRDTPVQVAGGLKFTAISAGGDHTCGIATSGAAFCWGSNIDGQGGRGTSGDVSFVPVAVAGGLTFTRISASTGTRAVGTNGVPFKPSGLGHTCALTSAGAAFCWGDDRDLQLGQGPFSGAGGIATVPVQVAQGERAGGVTFTGISVGSRHSCAVGSDGAAYCWGSNVMGALGNTLQAAFRGLPQKVATPQ